MSELPFTPHRILLGIYKSPLFKKILGICTYSITNHDPIIHWVINNMITINEALNIIKDNMPAPGIEAVATNLSLGYVTAEGVLAPEPSPRFDNSGMDGFAVRWDDVLMVAGGGTVTLKVIGESRAGVPFSGVIDSGEAIRISTGAVVPPDADTVVPIEDIDIFDDKIIIKSVAKKYKHIRFRAEEINIGDILIAKNTIINPANIALLASMGIEDVSAYKKPDVGILVTGTELTASGPDIGDGRIRDSNGIMLESAVRVSGGNITYSGIVDDDPDGLRCKIIEAMNRSQIILLSGGVSVGPHDHVKQVSADLGFRQLFWKVRQKPGKPLYVARFEDRILFGLPGNPVSALNCYAFYIHPVICDLLGREFSWHCVDGQIHEGFQNNGDRSVFVRSRIKKSGLNKDYSVEPLQNQDSYMLTSISEANGFFIIGPGEHFDKEDKVRTYFYPWEQ